MKNQYVFNSLSALLLCCTLLFIGCGKTRDNSPGNVFHYNISNGYLETIDPAYAKTLDMMRVDHLIYNTLIETDEDLHLVPSLAKSWELSENGLTYTIHLRDDVYFHDNPLFIGGKGRKMVASDVVFSLARILDPTVASYGAWIFNDRVADKAPFVVIDDTTVQINLKRPFMPFPEILTMSYCSIVPQEVVRQWGKDFRAHPCGTGPFQFHYWDEANLLVLHRNPHYWEKDSSGNRLPYLDAVEVTFKDSKATEFLLFLQGKLDFVTGVDGSFKDLVLVKNGTLQDDYKNKFNLDKQTYLNVEYIGFLVDTTNPVMAHAATNNKLVRQAINYAIDRKKIVTYFRNGIGVPATEGFIPKGLPGYDSNAAYGYHYNPAKALELLAKAGYPNGRGLPPIKILTPDIWSDIVNFVANQLQDVGIHVNVETIQNNVLRQEMSRSNAPAFRGTWIADYPDAESYMAVFNSRLPAPPNYTRFSDLTFDKWYDMAMLAPDSVRWQLYTRMDSLVMSYAPVVPLFYDQILHFTQKKVRGFRCNPLNIFDLKYVKLD